MVKLNIQLPEHFLEGETRDGYYVSPEMKKVWAVELDLLNEFMRVCTKYNLRWFADGGTILGAVRHGGMIPWDDDIDVMMLREDYEKLNRIAPTEFKYPYFWHNEYTDPPCLRYFSRLRNSNTTALQTFERGRSFQFNQGIFIDIFPVDNIPDSIEQRKEFIAMLANKQNKARTVRDLTICYQTKKGRGVVKCIKHWIKHIVWMTMWKRKNDYRKYFVDADNYAQKYNDTITAYISKTWTIPAEKRFWKREWLNTVEYVNFEWFEIPLPGGYMELLEKFYGNWHEFVIGANQHGEVFFDVNKSYLEYIK